MAIIDEATAWKILDLYSTECRGIAPGSLMAVYATGSLPAGYYRPGQSDIDAVLIVRDGSEEVWGNSDTPAEKLAALNREYRHRYDIPRDFGPFPLQPHEVYPPYDCRRELTLEIARLKLQGRLVWGAFPLDDVPMPAEEDYLRDFRHFEEYWESHFSKETPAERMSAEQCVNTVLMHMQRYLMIRKGTIEFDKRRILPLYETGQGPFVSKPVLDAVHRHLETGTITEEETVLLRQHVPDLRYNMNGLLGLR